MHPKPKLTLWEFSHKVRWIVLAALIYGGLQCASVFIFARDMARMNSLYGPVAKMNGALRQWDLETKNQGRRVPTKLELVNSGYIKPSGEYRVMGETIEMPPKLPESARAILPRRVLSFPPGTKVMLHEQKLGVQRPGQQITIWTRSERAGWIPFLWMRN